MRSRISRGRWSLMKARTSSRKAASSGVNRRSMARFLLMSLPGSVRRAAVAGKPRLAQDGCLRREVGMGQSNTVRVAVLPGDGIGTEVTEATLAVLEKLTKRHGIG